MNKYNVELLAPAGNVEAFMGAIHAGADAVYLAGSKFGARAYADNFTNEQLIECIRYAHIFGRKVYLTVNTLFKEDEIQELYDYLAPFYEAGLDAVIVQDIGVFQFIKRNFPDLELHVSTQMTITGEYGAEMLKKMGASRIVPARELSLKEIVNMKAKTGIEIETFIHGAMCYCYSGQCLFSSILGGRSGNRGRCAQPCRLPYSVDTSDKHISECYPLSLKDMCTLEHIGEFMDAGIDSFKIEGRMKKPEYAAGVTAIYRKYIDLKIKNPAKEIKIDKNDWHALTSLYIRSKRQDGYYYKHNGADMVTLESPAYSGNDDVLLAQIRQKYIENTLRHPVSIYASFYTGCEVSITCTSGDISVIVTGDIMEPAKNQPITEETITKQLKKLGETPFELEYIHVTTDNLGFYSLKSINELRRRAIKELEDELIRAYGLTVSRKQVSKSRLENLLSSVDSTQRDHSWTILVSNEQQLQTVTEFLRNRKHAVSRIYIESDIFLRNSELQLPKEVPTYIAMPYIMRLKDTDLLAKIVHTAEERSEIKGILIRNLEEYHFLKTYEYKGNIITDAGIYIWNHESLHFWEDKVHTVTCPIELNKREWQLLFQKSNIEKNIYGRLPMMITANCVSKTTGKCLKGTGTSISYLTDRYKKKIPVIIQCNYCMNVVLNSIPLSLHSKDCLKWYDTVIKRISFTTEEPDEVKEILSFFSDIQKGIDVQPPFKEYTAGHEKRGVE